MHLFGLAIVVVDSMIRTYPYVPLAIFIDFANTIMTQGIRRTVLLIPGNIAIRCISTGIHSKTNQAIGSTQPPFSISGLTNFMQTVTFPRKSYLIKRSILEISMRGKTGQTIIRSYPHILPLIHKTRPDDIIRNGRSITGVVLEMQNGIVQRQAIESIICSNIQIAIGFFCQTLDGIAIQLRNPCKILQL